MPQTPMVFETDMIYPQRKRQHPDWAHETGYESAQKRHLSEELAFSLGMLGIDQTSQNTSHTGFPPQHQHQHEQQQYFQPQCPQYPQENFGEQQFGCDFSLVPRPSPIQDIEPASPVIIEDEVGSWESSFPEVLSPVSNHNALVRLPSYIPFCMLPAEIQRKAIVPYSPLTRPVKNAIGWTSDGNEQNNMEDDDGDSLSSSSDDPTRLPYFMEVD